MPRAKTDGLPPNIYRKHGGYYYVKRGCWTFLGREFSGAVDVQSKLPADREAILRYCARLLPRARQNARSRRVIPFTLARDDIRLMLTRAGWRCAVTGIEFSLEVIGGKKPYAPSIDRIDSSGGYSADNCRVVCVAANYAMNVWGEQVLLKMLRSARRRGVLDRPATQLDRIA